MCVEGLGRCVDDAKGVEVDSEDVGRKGSEGGQDTGSMDGSRLEVEWCPV
jgi:hypothetical protein